MNVNQFKNKLKEDKILLALKDKQEKNRIKFLIKENLLDKYLQERINSTLENNPDIHSRMVIVKATDIFGEYLTRKFPVESKFLWKKTTNYYPLYLSDLIEKFCKEHSIKEYKVYDILEEMILDIFKEKGFLFLKTEYENKHRGYISASSGRWKKTFKFGDLDSNRKSKYFYFKF